MLDTTQTRESAEQVEFFREEHFTWALRSRQRIPLPRDTVFEFFADAANLGRITPPEVGFRILSPLPIAMRVGTLIDYEIQLWRIPMKWRTEISAWNPPVEFSDVQLRGPYAEWVHRHRFIELSRGMTLVEDEVRFRLPLGWLGATAGVLVRHQLRRIFEFRRGVISRLADDAALTHPAQGSTPGL